MAKRVENGEWEARRKRVEGLHRSHGTGFLMGRDLIQLNGRTLKFLYSTFSHEYVNS